MHFANSNRLSWLSSILSERYGVIVRLCFSDNTIKLYIDNLPNCITFVNLDHSFYKINSILKCFWWDCTSEGFYNKISNLLPTPSSKPLANNIFVFKKNCIEVNYDILGLIYWALNRLEEINSKSLDNHNRYLSTSSHAYKYNYLHTACR